MERQQMNTAVNPLAQGYADRSGVWRMQHRNITPRETRSAANTEKDKTKLSYTEISILKNISCEYLWVVFALA